MISAKLSYAKSIVFDDITGIPILQTTQTMDGGESFVFDQSNEKDVSTNPLLEDPYEKSLVYVGQSKIAGRGIFTRVPLKKGTVLAFYNGVRYGLSNSKMKDKGLSFYRIDNDWAKFDEVIDIPKKYRSLQTYKATLGHLVNHSNEPNAHFSMFDHPRFGKIRSIKLNNDLPAFEELLCNYGYLETFENLNKIIDGIVTFSKWMNSNDLPTFQKNMKNGIQLARNFVTTLSD